MTATRVGEPVYRVEQGKPTLSLDIDRDGRKHVVWYQASSGPIAQNGEPGLASAILPAMQIGGSLRVAGPVSPKLQASVELIQDIYSIWYSERRRVALDAPAAPNANGGLAERGVGCFFSTGVDSFYSLLKNRDAVTTLILVRGFDVPLKAEWDSLWNRLRDSVHAIAKEMGLKVIEVETNVREFSDQYADWGAYHGAVLAAVSLLLSPQIRKIIIPSSHDYGQLFPWGSHPMLDPLWSTEQTELIHDGCEALRVEKVAKLGTSDIAMRFLRVCWENRDGKYNCGRCEKCLRTLINLRLTGHKDRCKSFDGPLDIAMVRRMPIPGESTRSFIQENLRYAVQGGADQELIDSLNDALDGVYYQGPWGWPRRAWGIVRRLAR